MISCVSICRNHPIFYRIDVMSLPETAALREDHLEFETAELKKRLTSCESEESLSEWELARSTSKTWSMEQD